MRIPLTAAQERALAGLRRDLPGTRLVLIGTAALGFHLALPRETEDVDLAMVASPEDVGPLLTPLGWKRDRRIAQRWHGAGGVIADLIPCSPDAIARGSVKLGAAAPKMTLVGFDLVLRHAITVLLPNERVTLEVSSLPSLVVLKIVSWLDRPYQRGRDLADLSSVLEHALAEDDERRWNPNDPVGGADLDFEDQSAFFIGHEVAKISAEDHRERVEAFLQAVGADDSLGFAQMLREAAYVGHRREERLLRRIAAFRLGLHRGSEGQT